MGALKQKSAIVTGSSSGIGKETARELAREGANVALAARSEDRLHALAEEIEANHGVDTLVVPTNVRNEAAVEELIAATVDKFDGIDILVNNAGTSRGSELETMETERYEQIQETNIDGVFYATRAAIPHVRDSGGHLIFIGSFVGQYPLSFNPIYVGSKWWVRGFAKSVAGQVGDDGVGVTVINPAEVRSEFPRFDGSTYAEAFDEGEASEPEEVAEAVAFAATREGSVASEIDLYRRDKFATDF